MVLIDYLRVYALIFATLLLGLAAGVGTRAARGRCAHARRAGVACPARSGERAQLRERADGHSAVTVAVDGSVTEAHVDHAVSPAFDQAALDVIKLWKFSPAKRGETPIPSAVRVAVRFTPPDFDLSDHGPVLDPHAAPPPPFPPAAPPAAPEPAPEAAPPLPPPAERTALSAAAKVHAATLRPEARSGSDFVIERDVLHAAPHRDATAMLQAAPGVYVARSEGDAVAPHVTLRGFDAEHGKTPPAPPT